jgi:EAL domain-containing protein (putative c-di-GMP-specific phosphodiesterase class I)
MTVVAEGIEESDQLHCLLELNCDLFQGFHISMPLEADAAREFASRRPTTLVPAQAE